ncbi:hypothetical protein H5410_062324 [Solanum commersonii]|uniref:Uncharacterized protein n=1 Tax=Solanum commersonii TaxID=4109 RepID=A0A9J5WCB2_SOLCO|nr:hypothetical protein H5410_062324 [Solanum commersonii]
MAYEESHVSIGENNKFGIKTKHSIRDVTKVQKGRAPYGGADLLRRPRPNKNSAISLKEPSMFTSSTNAIFILCSFLLRHTPDNIPSLSPETILTSLAYENSHESRNRGIHILKHVSRVLQERENEGASARRGGKFHLDTYSNEFELKTKHLIAHVGKGQKGRGPNGGSNNLHHARPYKSSALSLKQPFIFTSTSDAIFRFSLLLVLLFVFP